MANAADIVVKKFDGTTDVTYVVYNGASGDGVKALWRSDSQGTTAAVRPQVTMWSRNNGQKTARRVDWEVSFPQSYTDTTTGLVSSRNRTVMNGSFLVPTGMDNGAAAEAAYQSANIVASPAFKTSFLYGFAPT